MPQLKPASDETPSERRDGSDPRSSAKVRYTWLVVSRAAAAVLGGFVVTYWTGAAVAKTAMEWDLASRANAGMFSGLVQLVVYVAVIIGVCASASMKRAWLVLAAMTALLVGITVLTPGPPPAP